MASNEDLLRELVEMKTDLRNHIATEDPVLSAAQRLVDAHGADHEEVRARIQFVNLWMVREAKREEARDKLRQAIIEKGTITALFALGVYLFGLVSHDLGNLIKGFVVK